MAHPSSSPSRPNALTQRLSAALQGMSARERNALGLAAAVVVLALLWWVALAPAIRTLRQSAERQSVLDQQLTQMQSLAASVERLRAQNATPAPARDLAQKALEAATQAMGPGSSMTMQGDRAAVTLKDVDPTALANWLQQTRVNARVLPMEVKLQRNGTTGRWSGQVVLSGPGLGASR